MPSKYDTNPLDPDFPEKARAAAAGDEGEPTQVLRQGVAPTTQFAPQTEEQTRRFGTAEAAPFTNPYTGQHVPAPRGAYGASVQPGEKTVHGLPIAEHMLIAAPYIPWYIGLVAGILILLLVPRNETKIRFHAAQGLAAHVGILIVTMILGGVGNAFDLANIGAFIFSLVTSIMLVVFAVKAWQGKPVHIQSIEDLTNWLEDKISPRWAGK